MTELIGKKYDNGKAQIVKGFLLYFPNAIKAVTEISTYGYDKYGEWGNWKNLDGGLDRYTEAMVRHLVEEGRETYDPESRYLHAAHTAWNSNARLELMLRNGDLKLRND